MRGADDGCRCFPVDDDELATFRWWRVKLNQRQDYPGKVLLALRRHEEDVLALTQAERDDLWEAVRLVRDAVGHVLRPDWWNYMFLGNAMPHVHLHLIPRYAEPRTVHGWAFRDAHWGSLHARQESPPREVHEWLRDSLKQALI